mmetsp:Transcript_6908/g.11758  ORF Transcript_6908/g.11758 Transcript_6908/m.11758 type:complete len:210 (+) Transcript_6908:470-1099(+)
MWQGCHTHDCYSAPTNLMCRLRLENTTMLTANWCTMLSNRLPRPFESLAITIDNYCCTVPVLVLRTYAGEWSCPLPHHRVVYAQPCYPSTYLASTPRNPTYLQTTLKRGRLQLRASHQASPQHAIWKTDNPVCCFFSLHFNFLPPHTHDVGPPCTCTPLALITRRHNHMSLDPRQRHVCCTIAVGHGAQPITLKGCGSSTSPAVRRSAP